MGARYVTAIALLFALSVAVPSRPTHAQPADPPLNPTARADVGTLPNMNQTYRGEIPFLDRDTPLPEGEWTVISTYRSLYRDGPPTGGVALLRHQGNLLTGLIRMDGNKVPRETALPVSRVCTATGVIWTDMRAAEPGGAQDCVLINFDRTAVWRDIDAPPAFRAIVQSLDDYSVTPPPVMVSAVVFVANARYSLFAELLVNPDLAGIAPDLTTHRSQSDWASFNLSRDPQKQAYVDRLKAWTAGWRNVLKTVIDGGQSTAPPNVAATP